MKIDFKPNTNSKQEPMLNIFYRTQKLKLIGMKILSKNDKQKAKELVEEIQKYIFTRKKAPNYNYQIVSYNPLLFRVELKCLNNNQKRNLIISLSLLWKLFNLTSQEIICED